MGRNILYHSTRGQDLNKSFTSVLLSGLASDGGLYLPDHIPQIPPDKIIAWHGQTYRQIAADIISLFCDLSDDQINNIVDKSYQNFHHKAVAPIRQIDHNTFLLELYHGPTLAFKDIAMQFLGSLLDDVLASKNQRLTIIGATSGDTGSAAIEAFKNRDNVDVFMMHPQGRVSEIQRRQMTTVKADNVFNLAVNGTFDDCQNIVKQLFNDEDFRNKVNLSTVNSINWGRIIAQVVYYFTAAISLGAPYRQVSFTVPTGNFGDVYAGFIARKMGLPIDKLIIATNKNDILVRALNSGYYKPDTVSKTISPSMDIQVSSNFERLIYDSMLNHYQSQQTAAGATRQLFTDLAAAKQFQLPEFSLDYIKQFFTADSADEEKTKMTMANIWRDCQLLIDPHTAVGISVANKVGAENGQIPMIVLATADAAKFPEAVSETTGKWPDLPEHLQDIKQKEEFSFDIDKSSDLVKTFIMNHSSH